MSSIAYIILVVWLISLVGSKPVNDDTIEASQTADNQQKSETAEKTDEESGAFGLIRNVVHAFENIFSEKKVQEEFEKTRNLEIEDIPSTVDVKNETAVESFQRLFRTYVAILRGWNHGLAFKFKREFKSFYNYRLDYEDEALYVARFVDLLSRLEDDESTKVDGTWWDDENEVIKKLFELKGINETNILNVARTFYRLKPSKRVTTQKKIKIHAPDIEAEALKQFKECNSKDFVLEAALMPDAHSGYVAPIGSVIKTKGAVVPAWVGYDIGCGMIAIKISDTQKEQNQIRAKAKDIFNQVNRDIPMGTGGHNKYGRPPYLIDKMDLALEKLRKSTSYERLYSEISKKSEPNLGTLGTGNHFIEISTDGAETWLVIHSGSRNVGHTIGTYFMKAVSGLEKGFENTFAIEDPAMIDEYMYFQDYCLEFALLNRMSMAIKVEKAIHSVAGIKYDTYEKLWTNKNHNHCIKLGGNIYLHRKGATSSDKGERGVIPGNMRDGCYLVEGLGNSDFLCSSSHGAGRQMSRGEARRKVGINAFQAAMKGVVAPVHRNTIDESPFAYKNISKVLDYQKESAKVLKHLKPIINWKGV